MDNALFYGLFPRTSQNRIAQLFCKWADESKKFDQAKKAIAGLTKRGEKDIVLHICVTMEIKTVLNLSCRRSIFT